VALQIGTNFANDYSDGVRGTDTVRVGPVRLVASGLKRPGQVKRAAWAAFATAGAAGLALSAAAGWWLVAVGAASVAAGWFYTGGPRPYGYAGFGELFVFVFFGLVATVGTAYVQLGRFTALAVLAAVPVGLLSVAMLVVNNLRDIPGDTLTGKRTLAVKVGTRSTRVMYAACLMLAFAVALGMTAWRVGSILALFALPAALPPLRRVMGGAAGQQLIPVLGATGRTQLAFGILLAAGVWV
jgi:1,4-dihydroxy-2-naphthoate octaprenyltransferase